MGIAPVRLVGYGFGCLLLCCSVLAISDPVPTQSSQNTTRQSWRYHARGNLRHNMPASATPTMSPPTVLHNEMKDLITHLHDRVGILATLDEDQRHRLEVIDKKIDRLLDANEGRMESLKAQQLNFQQRLDSFEHIQRLTRHTLDEMKGEADAYFGARVARELKHKKQNRDKLRDLSRQTRQAPRQPSSVEAENVANIFSTQPHIQSRNAANQTDVMLDVAGKLDALATFLVSVAYNVRETQQSVSKLVQNTNNIRRRLANRGKGQSAHLPSNLGQLGPSLEADEVATSCLQSYLAVKGILKLQLTPDSDSFYVPCEDNGWTVIMNRSADDLNFQRSWLEYKEGFGNLAGDFFIGLDKLHALTTSSLHEMRIYLEDFNGNGAFAGYDAFAIAGEREFYTLNILGQFQQQLVPSAGDSLSYHAGSKFSTFDNDNDGCLECNCAQRHKSAGWWNSCGTSNIFGVYHGGNSAATAGETGIFWDTFQGKDYSVRRVKMVIRPVSQDDARRR